MKVIEKNKIPELAELLAGAVAEGKVGAVIINLEKGDDEMSLRVRTYREGEYTCMHERTYIVLLESDKMSLNEVIGELTKEDGNGDE